MKKIITALFILLSFLSFEVFANDDLSEPNDYCGLTDDGRIKPVDLTICKDDIAFSVIYENFKLFYDSYIFKIFPLSEWSSEEDYSDQDLSTRLRSSYVMSSLFESIISITFIFIFLVIMFNVVLGIFKSLEDGSFMGKDFSFKSQIFYYLMGAFLIIPVGSVFVIHLVILVVIMLALVPANFVFTYFVYFISSSGAPLINENPPEVVDYNHNYYYASKVLDYYINSDFCRQSTFNYIFTDGADTLNRDRQNFYECFLYNNTNNYYGINNSSNLVNPFFNYRVMNKDSEIGFYNNLSAGKELESEHCEEFDRDETHVSRFGCGNVFIHTPTKENYEVLNIDYNLFIESISGNLSNLSYGRFNYSEFVVNFDSFYSQYVDSANSLLLSLNSNEEDKRLAREFLTGSSKRRLQSQLIEAWYLTIYNHMNFGTKIVNLESDYNIIFNNQEFINGLKEETQNLSNLFYSYHCLSEPETLTKTYNFLNRPNENNKNAFCYNSITQDIYGSEYLGDVSFPLENEDELEFVIESSFNVLEDFVNKKEEVSDLIIYNYNQIERAIFNSYFLFEVDSYEDLEVFINARQGGFLAFPQILLFVEPDVSDWESVRNNIFRSTNYSLFVTEKMNVSDDVFDLSLNKSDSSFSIYDEVLRSYEDRVYNQESVDGNYIRDFTSYNIDSSNFFKVALDYVSGFLSLDINKLLGAMGLSGGMNFNDYVDYNEICSDPERLRDCPIPQVNPLVTFNTVGIEYMKSGVVYVGVSMMVNHMSTKFLKPSIKQKDSTGTDNTSVGTRRNTTGDRGTSGGIADMFVTIVKIISGGIVFYGLVILLLGAILAFSIPLIPFIHLVVNFIKWLIHAFNLLFVSNIFVGYLFNISESRDHVIKFYKENLMHIMLMPLFVIISMIFLWSFYYIMIFFINITLFTALEPVFAKPNSQILTGFFSILSMYILIFLVYTLTKFIFSSTASLYQKIFETLDVNSSGNDEKNVMDNIFAAFALESGFNNVVGKFRGIREKSHDDYKEGVNEFKEKENILERLSNDDHDSFPEEKMIGNKREKIDSKNLKIGDRVFEDENDFAMAMLDKDVYTKETKEKLRNKTDLINAIYDNENSESKNRILKKVEKLDIDNMTYDGAQYNSKADLLSRVVEDNPNSFMVQDGKDIEIMNRVYDKNNSMLKEYGKAGKDFGEFLKGGVKELSALPAFITEDIKKTVELNKIEKADSSISELLKKDKLSKEDKLKLEKLNKFFGKKINESKYLNNESKERLMDFKEKLDFNLKNNKNLNKDLSSVLLNLSSIIEKNKDKETKKDYFINKYNNYLEREKDKNLFKSHYDIIKDNNIDGYDFKKSFKKILKKDKN